MKLGSKTYLLVTVIQIIESTTSNDFKKSPSSFFNAHNNMMGNHFEHYHKRRPFFLGLKGKRNLLESFDPGIPTENKDENLITFPKSGTLFGKIDYNIKELPNIDDEIRRLINNYLNNIDNGFEKRSKDKYVYYGLRGKRQRLFKRSYEMAFQGRFLGLRGKKRSSEEFEDRLEPKDKRSRNHFHGMRGKF